MMHGAIVLTETLFDIPLKRADGQPATLRDYSGQVILVVNVASKCGLTVQYEALEKLYEERRDQGLVIAAFPANNFKEQEPGTDEEILSFCQSTYDVQFPVFSKISVKGADAHPLYRELTAAPVETTGEGPMRERLKGHGIDTGTPGDVLWNFEKFLIGRKGNIVARFAPDVTPDDPRLVNALNNEIGKTA
jgi:glutathione peroxidase